MRKTGKGYKVHKIMTGNEVSKESIGNQTKKGKATYNEFNQTRLKMHCAYYQASVCVCACIVFTFLVLIVSLKSVLWCIVVACVCFVIATVPQGSLSSCTRSSPIPVTVCSSLDSSLSVDFLSLSSVLLPWSSKSQLQCTYSCVLYAVDQYKVEHFTCSNRILSWQSLPLAGSAGHV